ncbi:MAG TPA: hypothetical protein DDW65_18465 [Firmicutes bacterium]|jgi:hypothetical protein|nr:hypothetical protein [Bacillota bacterium]
MISQIHLFNLIGSVISLFSVVFMVVIYWMIRRDAVKNSIREATQQVYKEWWGDELRDLRRYFYREFVPNYRKRLLGKCIKEIELTVADDQGRIRKLCYFFERVGWLGAAGLIDVDYILGPMQHCVRFVWLAMEPFIVEERKPHNLTEVDSSHHSVYLSGFEWLYKRSAHKHQAVLIREKFRKPRLHSWQEIRELRDRIDSDEAVFLKEL